MPYAALSTGIRVYYAAHGDARRPAVLLLAGRGGTTDDWGAQLPALAAEFHTVAFDARGSGRSDAPDEPYTVELLSADTVALLDALGLERAALVGLSFGGLVAQETAISYPKRLWALVLAATSAGPFNAEYPDPDEQERLRRLEPADEPGRAALRLIYTLETFERRPDLIERALRRGSRGPEHGARQQGHASAIYDNSDGLSRITAPTLILHGEADALVPPGNTSILGEAIPGARVLVLPGAHAFFVEHPELVNAALLEFLGRHSPG